MDYLKEIKKLYKNASDVKIKYYENFVLVYQEILGNINLFNRDYLQDLRDFDGDLNKIYPGIIEEVEINNLDDISNQIFTGNILIIYKKEIYHFVINNLPDRSVNDSIAEPDNILGARDGFIENIKTNVALIRTRLKINNLKIDDLTLGKRTKTNVKLLSIDGISNKRIRNQILEYLNKIDVDSVINAVDITQFLNEKTFVSSVTYTGSPDLASISLLNGQFIILVDRMPLCIMLPVSLLLMARERNDYEVPLYYAFFNRILITIAMFLAVFGVGILYSFLSHQSGNLSENIVSILKVTKRGIIFGPFTEIIITLLLFEFYSIVSNRSTGLTVQTIVIVLGGFLIGQNTISSGIIGVVILTLTALFYLLGYISSNNTILLVSISYARLFILISSLVFGLFGLVIGSILLLAYLYNQKTFGIPFTYAIAPLDLSDLKQFYLTRSCSYYKKRLNLFQTEDKNVKKNN